MKKIKGVSGCCGAEMYEAPAYYCTQMDKVPMVKVCSNCGCKTTPDLFGTLKIKKPTIKIKLK
jgi:hypothetical protein